MASEDGRPLGAVLDQVLELTALLGDDMERDLARRGLTRARTTVLWIVGIHGPSTQRALADALGVSARNITGLVDGLEAAGLATRERHPTDRRATLVTPTAAGAALVEELRGERAELATQLLGGLSDRRLGELRKALDHVLGELRALTAPG